jgi:hypothetical protein
MKGSIAAISRPAMQNLNRMVFPLLLQSLGQSSAADPSVCYNLLSTCQQCQQAVAIYSGYKLHGRIFQRGTHLKYCRMATPYHHMRLVASFGELKPGSTAWKGASRPSAGLPPPALALTNATKREVLCLHAPVQGSDVPRNDAASFATGLRHHQRSLKVSKA